MIDQAHLDLMTGGDAALQDEVLALFEAQAPLWLRLLTPDAPVQTWGDVAHSIKGSARGLGLWPLAERCEAAEALSRGPGVDLVIASRALAVVREALADALGDIAAWRAERQRRGAADGAGRGL